MSSKVDVWQRTLALMDLKPLEQTTAILARFLNAQIA